MIARNGAVVPMRFIGIVLFFASASLCAMAQSPHGPAPPGGSNAPPPIPEPHRTDDHTSDFLIIGFGST